MPDSKLYNALIWLMCVLAWAAMLREFWIALANTAPA